MLTARRTKTLSTLVCPNAETAETRSLRSRHPHMLPTVHRDENQPRCLARVKEKHTKRIVETSGLFLFLLTLKTHFLVSAFALLNTRGPVMRNRTIQTQM